MIRSLIKILIGVCLCFDLSADPYITTDISQDAEQRVFKVEVKNPDVKAATYEVRFSAEIIGTDGQSKWQILEANDGKPYILILDVNGGGRESLSINLLQILGCTNNATKLKVEFMLKSKGQNQEEVTTSCKVYDLSFDK